jgi:hypothetical protein
MVISVSFSSCDGQALFGLLVDKRRVTALQALVGKVTGLAPLVLVEDQITAAARASLVKHSCDFLHCLVL